MRPAFILCSARTRSTLLSAMLGRHSQIFATPELLLFTADTLGEVMGAPTPDYPARLVDARRSGLVRVVAQVHSGGQEPDALAAASVWLDAHAARPATWLLDELLATVRAEVIVEKSPDTTSTPRNLQRCLDYREDAAYIVLIRNPWAVLDSMWRHWTRLMDGLEPAAIVRRCAVACYTSVNTLAGCVPEAQRDEAWLTVRSEDLVSEPQTVLSSIVTHLGLDWSGEESAAMMHPERWEFAHGGSTGQLAGGDPTFLANPRFAPFHERQDHRARVLPLLADQPKAVDALDALACSLGYQPEGVKA